MNYRHPSGRKLRISAVSYLNTVPLVWGMLHGEEQGLFDLEFSLPSECADRLAAGDADIGIVPSAELPRLGLATIPGAGIASRGAVRSILLISKVAPAEIRVLAADTSSRTSVQLARLLLRRIHGNTPRLTPCPPDLDTMLKSADAALIIGDPALRVEIKDSPYTVLDLGEEWTAATGLPMVFAVWAGRPECVTDELARPFLNSCRFGLEHIDEIARQEAAPRGLSEDIVREYFTRNVTLLLGEDEKRGLEVFLRWLAGSADQGPCGGSTA
ncbi:MAG: menaquinone biosynthesis protein [Bryobacterales bacterium]|nr:menaquinone biosynthesis protein [Bryobacterales bacterium]